MSLQGNLPRLILILISFGIVIVTTDFLTQRFIFSGQTETVALANAVKKTQEREMVFSAFFTRSENTITSIRESDSFKQFLIGSSSSRQSLEELALAMAKSQKDIMKIRYIDESGMEVVRIERDRLDEPATVVAQSQLQDKAHRYFYYESIGRPADKVWFSDLDLNMEHGKVEIPYKPTLRAIMPLADQQAFKGILIINYFMQPLFDDLTNAPLYNVILADEDGEILMHYDPDRNWSRYTGRPGLSSDLPDMGMVLQHDTYGTSSFFSRRLHLPLSQQLVLILSLNSEYVAFQETHIKQNLKYSSGITLFITTVFGLIFAGLLNKFFVAYASQGRHINELKSLNRRIQNLLQKNRVYMELASDGIHVLDQQGNVVALSHSFASMLGYTEQEASQLNVRDWEAEILPEQITKNMSSFTGESKRFETKHRRKDGSIIEVEINGKWITTTDGIFFYASSRDITERKQMEKELRHLATTDFLTQLPTRREFFNQLSVELERFHRKKNYPVTVIILDLDHFKAINDSYGHRTGDHVLKQVANILSDEIRKVDVAGRLGGEEFGLILTDTSKEMAVHFTNRIRTRIADASLPVDQHIITYTISIGITEMNEQDSDIEAILERADRALYQAKKNGRNRVEIYQKI
jgi:diguanylate cyclase (GGDEF)-like protein/PAS domain S-box-containing protein